MKRIISLVIAVILVLTLGACFVYAEGEPPAGTNSETLGNSGAEGSTPTVEVQDESKFDKLLEGVTNSTFWVSAVALLTAVGAIIAIVVKKSGTIVGFFKLIHILLSNNAKTEDIANTNQGITDISNKLDGLNDALSALESKENKLMTLFTIFISNANINPNAKAEMMNYLTGIKSVAGEVVDVVNEANKAISKANAAEEKIPTPALDSITDGDDGDTEGGMVLD